MKKSLFLFCIFSIFGSIYAKEITLDEQNFRSTVIMKPIPMPPRPRSTGALTILKMIENQEKKKMPEKYKKNEDNFNIVTAVKSIKRLDVNYFKSHPLNTFLMVLAFCFTAFILSLPCQLYLYFLRKSAKTYYE